MKLPAEIDLDAAPTVTGMIPAGGAPVLAAVTDADVEALAVHGCHVAQVLCGRMPKCPICGFGVRWRPRVEPAAIPWAFWREDEQRMEVTHAECVTDYLLSHPSSQAFPIGKLGSDFRADLECILWNHYQPGADPQDAALIAQPA